MVRLRSKPNTYAAAEGSTDCETFLSAVLLVIAKSLNLPARYGCIVWNFNRQARGLTAAEGTINFTGPSEEDPYQSEDWPTCVVCEAPCDDVDVSPGGNRSQNCARCFPCCLCDECRIYLPKEAFDDYARKQMARYGGAAATRHVASVLSLLRRRGRRSCICGRRDFVPKAGLSTQRAQVRPPCAPPQRAHSGGPQARRLKSSSPSEPIDFFRV